MSSAPKDKAASEKPASEKPASEKPASEKTASEKTASEKAASEKTASGKPGTATGTAAAGTAATDKPATDKPATDKPATDKPAGPRDARQLLDDLFRPTPEKLDIRRPIVTPTTPDRRTPDGRTPSRDDRDGSDRKPDLDPFRGGPGRAGLNTDPRTLLIPDGSFIIAQPVGVVRIAGVVFIQTVGRLFPVLPGQGLTEFTEALQTSRKPFYLVTAQFTAYSGQNYVLIRRAERLPAESIALTIDDELRAMMEDFERAIGAEGVDKPPGWSPSDPVYDPTDPAGRALAETLSALTRPLPWPVDPRMPIDPRAPLGTPGPAVSPKPLPDRPAILRARELPRSTRRAAMGLLPVSSDPLVARARARELDRNPDVSGHLITSPLPTGADKPLEFFREDPTRAKLISPERESQRLIGQQQQNLPPRLRGAGELLGSSTARPPRAATSSSTSSSPVEGREVREEGTPLINRSGRLIYNPSGAMFFFDSGEPPILILPSAQLTVADAYTDSGRLRVKLRISGELTLHNGRNHLLLSRVVPEPYDISELK